MKKNPNYLKQIDEIMENFDFKKVRKTMTFLKWSWHDTIGAPSIEKLKEQALSLLTEITKEKDTVCYISCGGFKATKMYHKLGLSFEVEAWDIDEI